MSYSLKKPTRAGQAVATAAGGTATAPFAGGTAVEEVKRAFIAVFGRIERHLGVQWAGASDRLRARFPDAWQETEDAEKNADEIAAAFIAGRASTEVLEEALVRYERAWADAAELLDGDTLEDDRRCSECGRTEMTVVVRDDDGSTFCRRCFGNQP